MHHRPALSRTAKAAATITAAAGMITAALTSQPAAASSGEYLVNYHSHLCLGVAGGRTNARAVQWTCNNSANQTWHRGAEYGNSGYYQVVNGDNQCLGIRGGSTAAGAQVVGWNCLPGHWDQYWSVPGLTCNGSYPIVNLKSAEVAGVSGNSKSNGADVIEWSYQKTCNNQFWAWSIPA